MTDDPTRLDPIAADFAVPAKRPAPRRWGPRDVVPIGPSPVNEARPRPVERPERKPSAFSLVARLGNLIDNLDAYINDRAKRIAAKRIAEVETAAQARIAEVERELLVDRNRHTDLVAELRRIMAVGHRRADALQAQVNRAREIQEDFANHNVPPEERLAALLQDMPPAGRLSDYSTDQNGEPS